MSENSSEKKVSSTSKYIRINNLNKKQTTPKNIINKWKPENLSLIIVRTVNIPKAIYIIKVKILIPILIDFYFKTKWKYVKFLFSYPVS